MLDRSELWRTGQILIQPVLFAITCSARGTSTVRLRYTDQQIMLLHQEASVNKSARLLLRSERRMRVGAYLSRFAHQA